jgi:hypothetical protein
MELLLSWHGIAQSHISQRLRMQKKVKWKELVDSKKDPSPYQKWTDEDERKLNHLETREIDISETSRGRADCTIKENARHIQQNEQE